MDHDADTLNEVVIPLMNVSRRDPNGYIDPTEPNQAQLYLTSAGGKNTFAYQKLIEIFIQSIIDPENSFIFGCDYRIPMMHGLLSKQLINNLKIDPTMKEESFAREYLSIWTGGSENSWVSWEKLAKYRTIVNPHKKQKIQVGEPSFYLIAVDVARRGVLTSIQIFKAVKKQDYYQKQLVNSIALHDSHFQTQAIQLKRLIRDYRPREVVIDTTGIGVGLMDFMVLPQVDPETGEIFPPYTSLNDEDYMKYDGERIIYNLKANARINSECHSNFYTQIASGHCRFLIGEEEARQKLLATKKGQSMSAVDKMERLRPHREVQLLFDEISNLQLKLSADSKVVVEQMNSRIAKDRFSAYEYGLWRLKAIEDEVIKEENRSKIDFTQFVFFTKGGKHK